MSANLESLIEVIKRGEFLVSIHRIVSVETLKIALGHLKSSMAYKVLQHLVTLILTVV